MHAVVIARELKKKLVEQNKLEVLQPEVEKTLFNLIVFLHDFLYFIQFFL